MRNATPAFAAALALAFGVQAFADDDVAAFLQRPDTKSVEGRAVPAKPAAGQDDKKDPSPRDFELKPLRAVFPRVTTPGGKTLDYNEKVSGRDNKERIRDFLSRAPIEHQKQLLISSKFVERNHKFPAGDALLIPIASPGKALRLELGNGERCCVAFRDWVTESLEVGGRFVTMDQLAKAWHEGKWVEARGASGHGPSIKKVESYYSFEDRKLARVGTVPVKYYLDLRRKGAQGNVTGEVQKWESDLEVTFSEIDFKGMNKDFARFREDNREVRPDPREDQAAIKKGWGVSEQVEQFDIGAIKIEAVR